MSCSTRICIFSTVSVSPRQPFTCAQPVMPSFTLWRIDVAEIDVEASYLRPGCGYQAYMSLPDGSGMARPSARAVSIHSSMTRSAFFTAS